MCGECNWPMDNISINKKICPKCKRNADHLFCEPYQEKVFQMTCEAWEEEGFHLNKDQQKLAFEEWLHQERFGGSRMESFMKIDKIIKSIQTTAKIHNDLQYLERI